MKKRILLNIESKEKRYASIKNGRLNNLIVERHSNRRLTGNIYCGKVTNILNNIQSAFIDIGEGENGFIHIDDILENSQKLQERFDMAFDWDEELQQMDSKKKEADISKLLKLDQNVLVQVVKEPIGSKGARLTANVTIPGRYLVLLPNAPHRGVSRKIQDRAARDRLKKIINAFEMPKEIGLICRTASQTASMETLIEEAHELLKAWKSVVRSYKKETEPTCLFRESDLIKKAVLTAIDREYNELIVDDYRTYQTCVKLYNTYKGDSKVDIQYYRDSLPLFTKEGIEGEIEKALRHKIWLPSGGYLFFDRTEAMYTIDVNSGRSTGKKASSVDEVLVRINMEACDEIARQLRLRNIGGLIICDFIDMRSRKNQRRVLDHLREAMKEDGAKCTILGMSEFGLVEMTRQRNRESLHQTLLTHCPYCSGHGLIKNHETTSIEIERVLNHLFAREKHKRIKLIVHPEMNNYLCKGGKDSLLSLAKKWKSDITFGTKDSLHLNTFELYSKDHDRILEV